MGTEKEGSLSSAHDVSSFGFINSDEGGSAFSFMQPGPAETTGFSFMTESTEIPTVDPNQYSQAPSSFSILASDISATLSMNSNHVTDASGLLSQQAPRDNMLPNVVMSDIKQQELADLKLNATSLVKTVCNSFVSL